jgi:hypothetical protein
MALHEKQLELGLYSTALLFFTKKKGFGLAMPVATAMPLAIGLYSKHGSEKQYSGFHFRPHMRTRSFFVPEGPKSQTCSGTGRLDLPTKSQWPFSE